MAGIFKSYDVRGLSPQEIHPEIAERIGAATAFHLKAKTLVVGYDMRPDSPDLRDAFMRGANSIGCSCLDVGLVTTPLTYWAVQHEKTDGSVMITASHNPAGYNGMKICAGGPVALSYETGLNTIEALVNDPNFKLGDQTAQNRSLDPWPGYKKHILSFARNWKPLKVVVDAANGMGGLGVEKVFDDFPGDLIPMYFEPDGNFPNHEANPLKPECVLDLQNKVKETGADLGVALDGDADRCAFVDEKGDVVACDLTTALFAQSFLSQEPGGKVLYDLRSSRIVPETVSALGGSSIRERVGHSHMKKTLRESGAIFGGELSGHYYFRDHACSDSGLLAFVIMMNVLADGDAPLSERVAPLRKYAQSGEINFEIEDKLAAIENLANHYKDLEQDRLDGLTVQGEDWWFNARLSNTEPVLRLNLEAANDEDCRRRVNEVKALLQGGKSAGG